MEADKYQCEDDYLYDDLIREGGHGFDSNISAPQNHESKSLSENKKCFYSHREYYRNWKINQKKIENQKSKKGNQLQRRIKSKIEDTTVSEIE